MLDTYSDIGPIQATLELMDDPVMVTTADLDAPGPKIVFVNDAFTRITGYSKSEVIGDTPRFLQNSATDPEYVSRLRHDLLTKRSFVGETINRRKDGSEFSVKCQIVPLTDASGAVRYWLNIQRDTQAQKAAEIGQRTAKEQLNESERRQKIILDSILSRISYVDNQRRYQFTNKAYQTYYGHPIEYFKRKHMKDVVGRDVYDFAKSNVEKALSGQKVRFDYVDYRKGAEHYWDTTYVPDRDESGEVKGFYVLVNDVTERKRVEAALRDSEQRFQDYAASASDWFWEMGPDLRFTRFSEQLEGGMGVSPERLIGKTREEFAALDGRDEKWTQHLEDLRRHRPFKNFEYQYLSDRGEPAYARVNGVPVIDQKGTFQGYRGTGSNITAQVLAKQQVQRANARLRDAIESITEGFALYDSDDRLVLYNKNYGTALAGISDLLAPGARFKELFRALVERGHIDVPDERVQNWIDDRLREHRTPGLKREYRTRDGRWIEVREYATGEGGTAIIRSDVAERKWAEEALRASEEKYRLLVENQTDMVVKVDPHGRFTFVSPSYCKKFAKKEEELLGKSFMPLVHEGDRKSTRKAMENLFRPPYAAYMEQRALTANGWRWLAWSDNAVVDDNGNVDAIVGVGRDITERKRTEEALFNEKERAEVTLHSIGDAVITTDPCGVVDYMNPIAETLTGWSTSEATGQPLETVFRVINEQSRQPATDPVARCLKDGKIVGLANHSILIGRDGKEHAIEDSAAPIRGYDGQILGAVLVFHDVSETRRLARQLAHDATHDSLTGLANRREFERRLEHAISSARQYGSHHALCYIDLDQFKLVNDTAGHAAGDELLKQVRGLLAGKFRERDTLARLGGDEFALLLENCTLDRALKISEMVIATLRDHRFRWEKRNFHIGASIGMVAVTAESESAAQLLTQADVACYAAKEGGRNRVHLYQQEGTEPPESHAQMIRAAALRDAIENDRFRLYCQPIAPLSPGNDEPIRYEFLLRMLDTDGELVWPRAFIPAAERYGLMSLIDRWVIRTAFRRCATMFSDSAWTEVSINLSGNSLDDDTLADFLDEQFAEFSVPPDRVCFEITETTAFHNLSQAIGLISKIKKTGSRFALDDFGSGLSSFAYLKSLPVDYLKIDGGFVRDMMENSIDDSMVKAINEVGHIMGIRTIAEYAHSSMIVERLKEIGVDYAQGDAIGFPVPMDEISF